MKGISIAMATYNGSAYIREQLDSLAKQTMTPCELVVSDDGSADATLSIIEDFAASAPFPVFVHRNPERLGFVKNFLRAASLCRGAWIAFCDQDDYWMPNKLEVVSDRIAKHPDADLFQHSAIVTDERLSPIGRYLPHYTQDKEIAPLCETGFTRDDEFRGFAMVFRAGLLDLCESVQYPTSSFTTWDDYSHDRYIHMLARIFGKTALISEPLALYRRHGGNLSDYCKQQSFLKIMLERIRFLKTVIKEETFNFVERYGELGDILAEAKLNDPLLIERARKASAMYRERANMFAARGRLYDANRFKRVGGIFALLRISAYRPKDKGGLGMSGLASDLIKVVI